MKLWIMGQHCSHKISCGVMQGVRMHTSICTQWCWQALLLPSQHWCEVMVASSVTDLGFAS
jgi:hypothetical protein